jgi:hypothetical protein
MAATQTAAHPQYLMMACLVTTMAAAAAVVVRKYRTGGASGRRLRGEHNSFGEFFGV